MPQAGRRKGWGRAIVPILFLVLSVAASTPSFEDWAGSPEAYFLTVEERVEWKALDSNISRDQFKERYWLKRDPSHGSEKNEFHELVLGRIKIADSRFSIEKIPGSRTARGMAFIVLGTPARVSDEAAPRLANDAGGRRLGAGVTPVAVIEGNETTSTWFYDPDRTPRILQVLERPTLALKFVVEPSRRRDAVQDPGLFNELKEVVAHRSVVNPDLVPAGPAAGAGAGVASVSSASKETVFAAEAPALPRQILDEAVRKALDSAPASPRAGSSFAGSASLFHESGPAETVFWIFSPPVKNPVFHCVVRSEDGREVAAVTGPASISPLFSSQTGGVTVMRKVPLAPGSYSAALALTGDHGQVVASARLPIQVPAVDGRFAVSSLILSRGPAPGSRGKDDSFTFGSTFLPPRADSVFPSSQSVWYFVEIANPSDPARVMLEPRLRRGGQPVAGLPAFPARLESFGAARYLAGVELPLSSLGAGDYVLYLAVRDGESEGATQVLRRADFQVIP